MAVHSPIRKLTYEDFARLPEDGQRHEILDGVDVVTPAPFAFHQRLAFRVARKIADFADERSLGEVFVAPFDVVLSAHDIVEPDLFFIAASRLAIVTEKNVQGAPDLVIEILSPGTRRRDLGEKRARYELLGVREYWTLDPDAATAQIFRHGEGGFWRPIQLSAEADDQITTPLLPGFELPLREIFER